MLQIKNVIFNKGDYLYTIEYFDGKNVLKLATNDEALDSFSIAQKTLAAQLKKWLELSEEMNVSINAVKFGKNPEVASSMNLTVQKTGKSMTIVTKIHPVPSECLFPDEVLLACNESINELRGEVENYAMGKRAQAELDFSPESDEVEQC